MEKIWRIGTRDSQLAIWQANHTKILLEEKGIQTKIYPVKSEGDINLTTPLYEMGVQGIFTKTLDTALLNNEIDIAVHSYKDVPTELPKGLVKAAVLERADHRDLLVFNENLPFNVLQELCLKGKDLTNGSQFTIATSSTRRKSQWLNRFPKHQINSIRGNVNSRLKKLKESQWHAAIFAKAGLERINLVPSNAIEIDWMLPAPAQGAIVVVAREDDEILLAELGKINHAPTDLCTYIERSFLRILMGGCTTPISAHAYIKEELLYFSGQLLSLDGKQEISIQKVVKVKDASEIGKLAGVDILEKGGKELIHQIKASEKN